MRDRVVFFRALGVMFNAGIPINRALDMLADQFPGTLLGRTCAELTEEVESGMALHRAVALHPEVFTRIQCRLLEVGMRTGGLGSVLERLADYEEKQSRLVAKARSTLTYPAVVFTVCMLLVVFLPPYLFSDLFRMLTDSNTEVPAITRFVMLVSDVVRSPVFTFSLILVAALAIRFGPAFLKRPRVRRRLFAAVLWLKGVGPAVRALAVSRFARALDTMVSVGMPIQDSLRLAAQASDNPLLEEAAERAVALVLEGELISDALERTGFFPPLFVQGVKVGEEGGKLGTALTNVAGIYEVELESRLDTMTALLEPVVMLVIGLCVGFTVVATLLPLTRFIDQL